MKVLITGSQGQLGYELARSAPASAELTLTDQGELDITSHEQVLALIDQHRPDVIINGAAYTAVDKAESERELAHAVNAEGAANLAAAAKQYDARLIQVSTDFIFDGSQGTPYATDATPNPLSVYGATKLAGEQAVLGTLGGDALILRTAWVYSSHGSNFVKTILRLIGEKPQLGIIADQLGTPTWAGTLADNIWRAIDKKLTGIHHCTDAGVASWYDFAVAIQEEGQTLGLVDTPVPILPIRTSDYPTPATRPACSIMDKSVFWQALNIQPDHWRTVLRRMMHEL